MSVACRAAAQADPNRRKTPKKKPGVPGGGTGGIGAGSGASRKRKMAPVRAATDGMPSSFTPDSDAPQVGEWGERVRCERVWAVAAMSSSLTPTNGTAGE